MPAPSDLPASVTEARHVDAALVEPVRRVFRWLVSLRDADGRLVCPDHGVEHTGKNAYLIVLAVELARRDPDADVDRLFDVARTQARRLVERLEREGDSTCFTFRPGRHDPFNCSNNVIDGGACSDALAEFVRYFGERLDSAERDAAVAASVKHAQTYLRYAILDKGIPAQCAWAMTGTASAWRLSGHAVLELAVTEGAGRLAGIQSRDGSYPYHPIEFGAAHPGSSDASAYYQSRVTAFLLYALERLGRDPSGPPFRNQVARGVEFLRGLSGPDGVKVGAVEAKPWYWGAEYEVASNPFDVYALAAAGRWFGRRDWTMEARRAFDAWAKHVRSDGRPRDHMPGPGRARSYQCPVFWAAHAAWAARALGELDRAPADPVSDGLVIDVRVFDGASLARLEDGAVVAWIRGARPQSNVHHGSRRGAGLVRLYSKMRAADVDVRSEWTARGGGWNLARARAAVAGELRFSGWLARAGLRRGEWLRGPMAPARTALAGLRWGRGRASSEHVLDPTWTSFADGVELTSGLALADGTRLEGATLSRLYRLTGQGLEAEERLSGVRANWSGSGVLVDEAGPDAVRWHVS